MALPFCCQWPALPANPGNKRLARSTGQRKRTHRAGDGGRLTQTSTSLARQPFGLAADEYVSARKLELALASQAKEKQLLVQLRAYFQQVPLRSIAAKQIIEFRAWRAEQGVGPA